MKTFPVTLNFDENCVVGSLTLDARAVEMLKALPGQCITFSFTGKGATDPETLEPMDEWSVIGAALIPNSNLPRGKYKDLKR